MRMSRILMMISTKLSLILQQNNKTNMYTKKLNSKLFLLILIGLLSSFGPFVTDFYLPALPDISTYFHIPVSTTQLSLTFCMVGLALGQVVIGPLSDKFGRKLPLLLSLLLFMIANFVCIYASHATSFIVARFLQGLAGAGGVVISKSIVTDLYEGKEMAGFYSLLGVVQSLAPISAPVFGGLLLKFAPWEGIFWALLVLGAVIIALLLAFRESHPAERRLQGSFAAAFAHYAPVLRNKKFVYLMLVQSFALGAMFVYIASSPFIFQQIYGITPFGFSLCFAINASALIVGNLLIHCFRTTEQAVVVGAQGLLLAGIAVSLTLSMRLSFLLLEVCLYALLMATSILFTTSTALAMEQERSNSGTASAVLGCMGFLVGGIVSPLTSIGDIMQSTALLLFVCVSFTAWVAHKSVCVPLFPKIRRAFTCIRRR